MLRDVSINNYTKLSLVHKIQLFLFLMKVPGKLVIMEKKASNQKWYSSGINYEKSNKIQETRGPKSLIQGYQ